MSKEEFIKRLEEIEKIFKDNGWQDVEELKALIKEKEAILFRLKYQT